MGGLAVLGGLGNLFGALGGSSAKTDRAHQLGGYGDLINLFKYGFGHGKQMEGVGEGTTENALENLGPAAAYYRQLLNGGRQGALAAVAPTVNATNAQADARQRQLDSMGTARGGGVNAAEQGLQTEKMAAVDNAINQGRAGAAQGATQVAGVEGSLGGQQLQAALRLLGLGNEAATNLTSIAAGSRATSQAIHDKTVSDIGAGVANLLTGFGFGGSSGGGS